MVAFFFLVSQNDTAKEWEALGARYLVPSAITYEPKVNSRTVRGERTGGGARQENGTANGGARTVEKYQVGRTVNGVARLLGRPGKVEVPAELRADVCSHGL